MMDRSLLTVYKMLTVSIILSAAPLTAVHSKGSVDSWVATVTPVEQALEQNERSSGKRVNEVVKEAVKSEGSSEGSSERSSERSTEVNGILKEVVKKK